MAQDNIAVNDPKNNNNRTNNIEEYMLFVHINELGVYKHQGKYYKRRNNFAVGWSKSPLVGHTTQFFWKTNLNKHNIFQKPYNQ